MERTTKPRANSLAILSGRLIRFTERKSGATQTKHSPLVLFSPLVAFGDTVEDREEAVRSDRKKMTSHDHWIYKNTEKAFAKVAPIWPATVSTARSPEQTNWPERILAREEQQLPVLSTESARGLWRPMHQDDEF